MSTAQTASLLALLRSTTSNNSGIDCAEANHRDGNAGSMVTPTPSPVLKTQSNLEDNVAKAPKAAKSPVSITPAPQSTSRFYPSPITYGPFDPSKYRKPDQSAKRAISREKVAQPPKSKREQPSGQHSHSNDIRDHVDISYSQTRLHESGTNAEKHQAVSAPLNSLTNEPNTSTGVPQGTRINNEPSPNESLDLHTETAQMKQNGFLGRPISFAKTETDFTSSGHEPTSLISHPESVLNLRPTYHPTAPIKPITKGRPLPEGQYRVNYKMHSIPRDPRQSTSDSRTSGAALPGESPAENLARVQSQAMIKYVVSRRRQNQHDTASPEILAYIRQPLDPRVAEVVKYRVKHYFVIGNDNQSLSTMPSAGVEPAWPEGVNSAAAQPRGPSFKKSLEPFTSVSDLKAPFSAQKSKAPESTVEDGREPEMIISLNKRNPRWVTNADIRPPLQRPSSNAWGSDSSSGTAADSQDSIRAVGNAGGVKLGGTADYKPSLRGWDGKMQPPPVDWHDRPRFANTSVDFMNTVQSWGVGRARALVTASDPRGITYSVLEYGDLQDLGNHADGLGFVSATTMVTATNAKHYGYGDEVLKLTSQCDPIRQEDFDCVVIVNMDDPATADFADETTEILVQRWIGQNGWLNGKRLPIRKEPRKPKLLPPPAHYQQEPMASAPVMHISLRPGTVADITGMTRIYNWYVENSSKTTEFNKIPESDMRDRFDDVRSNKLPFIVAVSRNRVRDSNNNRDSGRGSARRSNANGHPITNTNPDYKGITEEENVVGWACASDFTASDYVERITAELELYVAPEARQYGVGKAVMDKLLDACDRGYLKQGGYDWCCATEIEHLYNGGGGRDLHKLYFVVRKWSKPIKALTNGNHGEAALKKANDMDDEWDAWLREWLEAWGFKVEGCLSQVGAKNGRLLDVVYMGRETKWQPEEGRIPDPLPGTY